MTNEEAKQTLVDFQAHMDQGDHESAYSAISSQIKNFPDGGNLVLLAKLHELGVECCTVLIEMEVLHIHAKSAADLYHQLGDTEKSWNCRLHEARYFFWKNDVSSALHVTQQCLDAAINGEWTNAEGLANQLLMRIEQKRGNYQQAIEHFLKARKLLSESGLTGMMEALYLGASSLYMAIGDMTASEKALAVARQYIEQDETTYDSLRVLFSQQYQAWMAQDLDRYFELCRQLSIMVEALDNPTLKVLCISNEGHYYLAKEQYLEAKKLFMKSWQLAQEHNIPPRRQAVSLTCLGIIAIHENDPGNARNHFRLSLDIVSGNEDMDEQIGEHYFAIALLADDKISEARKQWEGRQLPETSVEMNIECGWMLRLLQHIQTTEFQANHPLSGESLSLGKKWEAEISEMMLPKQ